MTRTGILLCACDGRIDQGIDVETVQAELRRDAHVTVTRVAHACLPDGIAEISRFFSENHIDQVVVAACPERFQQKRLGGACADGGIAANRFTLVGWREGCADAHRDDRVGGTRQALDLVRMGVARVSYAQSFSPARTPILSHALVIGGGIAGMTAAKALAERSIAVTLVERETELGGQLRDIPLNGATEKFQETKRAVTLSPHVALYLNSQVVSLDGEVGQFRVEISHPNGSAQLSVGAIVVATGAQEFRDPHLYHHDGRNILTLREFEPQIPSLNSHSIVYILCAGSRDAHVPYCSNVCCLGALHQALRVKRAHPATRVTIVFRDLYLLGDERNEQIVLDARRAGIEFLRYAPTAPPRVGEEAVTVRDLLTGTRQRITYDRIVLAAPLVPQDDAAMLARTLHQPVDENGFFIEPHHRVRPEQESERGIFLCGSAHHPVDVETAILQGEIAAARAARFLRKREIVHPAAAAFVRPDLCTGCAQCVETCAFAAISMRSPQTLFRNGSSNFWNFQVSSENDTNQRLVLNIETASQPSKAPQYGGSAGESAYLDHARIDPFLCLACGNCVAACPSRAIDLPGSSDAQIFAQLDAALEHKPADGVRDVVFACAWSGVAAMELAGARGQSYSADVRVIQLPCSARLSPVHVLYALLNGADRVLLALCPPGECHYEHGNRFAEMRLETLRAQLSARGIDPGRVRYARMMGDDAGAWIQAVAQVPA